MDDQLYGHGRPRGRLLGADGVSVDAGQDGDAVVLALVRPRHLGEVQFPVLRDELVRLVPGPHEGVGVLLEPVVFHRCNVSK